MPTPALATRLRSWFKREDRVGITERVERLEERVGDVEKSIKKLKDKQGGDSNPADNGSNDGNDNDGGTGGLTERMGALEESQDQSNMPHELQRRKTQAHPGELEDLIRHNVGKASLPFRGERSITVKDQEEDDSNKNEEGHCQHRNNIPYIEGKSSTTKDQGPSSQQQPASSHPSRSSPKHAIADAEGQTSSPEQLPLDRNRRDEDPDMNHWYAL